MLLLLPSHRILGPRRFVLQGFYPASLTPLLALICSSPCPLPEPALHNYERPHSYRLRIQRQPGSTLPRKPHWLALACGVYLLEWLPLPRQALASMHRVLHVEMCAPAQIIQAPRPNALPQYNAAKCWRPSSPEQSDSISQLRQAVPALYWPRPGAARAASLPAPVRMAQPVASQP